MQLLEFPSRQAIFLDANIFIYHATGTYPSCAVVFERALRRDIQAVTSVAIVTEVHHRLMAWEAAQQLGRPLRSIPSFLKRHPERIRALRRCHLITERLRALRIKVLPLTLGVVDEAQRLSHALGLLTTDAIIVATMRRRGLAHLASNDRDFLRVPGLTLWRP